MRRGHRRPVKRYTRADHGAGRFRRWPPTAVELAVIGGSGLYELLDDVEQVDVDTPYGPPSGPIAIGTDRSRRAVAGRSRFCRPSRPRPPVAPHTINYRANVWALHSLGVTPGARPVRVAAPCAPRSDPGDIVICDQFVDATWGRPGTFFDGPAVNHASIADPYCPQLGALAAGGSRARRVRRPSVRHRGGHPRPALRDPCRVGDLPPAGLRPDQHDAVPRGGAVPAS